jgi:hypothetical protein
MDDMPVVELLDLERVIAHRAWPYDRVIEHLDELESSGEPTLPLRLLACDIYERPDEECLPLLDALMAEPGAAIGRYSTMLAMCATRPGIAAKRLEGLLGELGALQRVVRALRARGPEGDMPDVRAFEQALVQLDHAIDAGTPHAEVELAARELAAMPGARTYRAPALERVLRSALLRSEVDDDVDRVLTEYMDAEIEPVRRTLVIIDTCRARDTIAAQRLQPLILELNALENMLRSAYRLRSARYENAGFPLREDRPLEE